MHTKELWDVIDGAIITEILNDYGNYVVVEIKRELTAQDQDNLERIVADHNALSGLNPEAVKGLVEAAEKLLDIFTDLPASRNYPDAVLGLRRALAAVRGGK